MNGWQYSCRLVPDTHALANWDRVSANKDRVRARKDRNAQRIRLRLRKKEIQKWWGKEIMFEKDRNAQRMRQKDKDWEMQKCTKGEINK